MVSHIRRYRYTNMMLFMPLMIVLCLLSVYLVVGQTPGVSLKIIPKNAKETTATPINVNLTAGYEGAYNTGHFKKRAKKFFIIHPYDPTVMICYLIPLCDIAVCITYLISHSYSLTYNLRIFHFGCTINTKLPSYDDIILRTSLGFPAGALKALVLRTRASKAPAVKTS